MTRTVDTSGLYPIVNLSRINPAVMIYLVIALLGLTIVSGSNDEINHDITPEEVQELFHTDYEPKYEVVKVDFPEELQKRQVPAGRAMHIRAFGEDINLWLERGNSVLAGEDTPVYFARYSSRHPGNVRFTRNETLMRSVGQIFEDPVRRASLVIGTDESGSTTVNGFIGSSRLAIRPVPTDIAEEYREKRRRSVDDSDDDDSQLHIVIRMDEDQEENSSVQVINATALQQRIGETINGTIIPDTIYPEILIVVEYSIYEHYRQDLSGLLQYILAFANGVDLKYRSVVSPKIRFHISGIVLAKNAKATPYISENSLGNNVFNSRVALNDSGTFFYAVRQTFPLGSYDIPLTLTRQLFGINRDEDILGLAWLSAACDIKHENKSVSSVSLVQDNGAFGAVHIAAHEIGHLLGASHDDEISERNCLYSNGYIMAYTPWYTKNSSDFSTCSIDGIYNTLQESYLDCLFNLPPNAGERLPKLMPGKIKTLTEQCRSLDKSVPCQNPNGPTDICVEIYCRNGRGQCVRTETAAIDGTTCGVNRFCLHMECVSL